MQERSYGFLSYNGTGRVLMIQWQRKLYDEKTGSGGIGVKLVSVYKMLLAMVNGEWSIEKQQI